MDGCSGPVHDVDFIAKWMYDKAFDILLQSSHKGQKGKGHSDQRWTIGYTVPPKVIGGGDVVPESLCRTI